MFSGLIAEQLRAAGHDVLAALLDQPTQIQPGQVLFLPRS
jgi:hypothetical protein